ncbi:MAG: chemotaxis protein CheW [Nitrospirota bacterium]
MDIARIRKKLKETKTAESQQSAVKSQTTETSVSSKQLAVSKSELNELKKADTEIREETEVIEILTFSLRREEFAFRVCQLEEILRHQVITMVPRMPSYVSGITSLRGKIIPVIDLRTKLFLTDRPSDIDQRGKILIIKGPKGPIGAAIDKVMGVVRIAKSKIIPPPSHLTEAELKFIEGIAIVDKRFISIIQMEEAIKIEL